MRRLAPCIVLALLLAGAGVNAAAGAGAAELSTEPAAEPAGPRAIWTWENESYAMLESEGAAAQGIAFLKSKAIGTIYLYADAWQGRNLIAFRPALYRKLVKRMHAHGLVERSTRKMALLAGFVEMSDALMRVKAQSGQALPVGAAIPFWLDGIQLAWQGKTKPVSQHLQDIYDYVALMDYRDHADGADGLVSHAMDELRYGETIGRPVLIGIETSPSEIRKVSFHHLGEADLERELAASSRSVASMRAFGGYVVHHYAAYRRWLGLE